MLRYFLIAVLIAITLYGVVEGWPLIAGPKLDLASPVEDGSYPDAIVEISGKAKRAAALIINGKPIRHGADGSFATVLTFPRGSSILTVTASDRFGRSVSVTRNIFVPN